MPCLAQYLDDDASKHPDPTSVHQIRNTSDDFLANSAQVCARARYFSLMAPLKRELVFIEVRTAPARAPLRRRACSPATHLHCVGEDSDETVSAPPSPPSSSPPRCRSSCQTAARSQATMQSQLIALLASVVIAVLNAFFRYVFPARPMAVPPGGLLAGSCLDVCSAE